MKNQKMLSGKRLRRMKEQGYFTQTDTQLSELAFGNRFAYRTCASILIVGVATASVPLLSFMVLVAFLGVILPHHPFDYIYNKFLAKRMNKPKLPKRSKQLKFACMIATAWIASTIFLFLCDFVFEGYVLGSILIAVALLVGFLDLCIPSIIYNAIFKENDRHFYF